MSPRPVVLSILALLPLAACGGTDGVEAVDGIARFAVGDGGSVGGCDSPFADSQLLTFLQQRGNRLTIDAGGLSIEGRLRSAGDGLGGLRERFSEGLDPGDVLELDFELPNNGGVTRYEGSLEAVEKPRGGLFFTALEGDIPWTFTPNGADTPTCSGTDEWREDEPTRFCRPSPPSVVTEIELPPAFQDQQVEFRTEFPPGQAIFATLTTPLRGQVDLSGSCADDCCVTATGDAGASRFVCDDPLPGLYQFHIAPDGFNPVPMSVELSSGGDIGGTLENPGPAFDFDPSFCGQTIFVRIVDR